jgi:hypothetical protein
MANPPIKKKYIESPERLWELFEEYLTDLKENPIRVHDFVGKDALEVYRFKERPVTMEGFRVFGYKNNVTVKHYFDNLNGSYDSYCTICTRIKDYIRCEQVEGGMAGIYNPSITQRLNNIVEKQEIENKVETVKTIIFKHEPLDD